MITFNKEDYNLPEIEKQCKFEGKMKHSYEIFGACQEENPPIGIRYNVDKHRQHDVEEDLKCFFRHNGIDVEMEHHNKENFLICLRKDIRENVLLASSLLQTIIYTLEGKLELDTDYKVTGLGKFQAT